jgi:hypothetical protein
MYKKTSNSKVSVLGQIVCILRSLQFNRSTFPIKNINVQIYTSGGHFIFG